MLNIIVCGAALRPLPRSHTCQSAPEGAARSAPDSSEAAAAVTRPVTPCFMLRCKQTGSCEDQSSDGHCSQELIYFEPMTRSLIQFPTYLYCEWDQLAPVLLNELHRSQAEPSLVNVIIKSLFSSNGFGKCL